MPNSESTKPACELEPGDVITLHDGDWIVLDRSMPGSDEGDDTLLVHLRTVDGRFKRAAAFDPELKLIVKEAISTKVYSRTAGGPRVRRLNKSELQILQALAETTGERTASAIAEHLGWSPWLVGRIMRRLESLGMVRTGMN